MNSLENLKIRASDLKRILKAYAETDPYAANALQNMEEIFLRIENGEVIPPVENKFRWYFSSTDSPLFGYSDLGEAAAQYSKAIELWK